MKSPEVTYRKHSSAGVDWASWVLGICLGFTLALPATTMRASDLSSVYAVVASVSRLAALTGTFFSMHRVGSAAQSWPSTACWVINRVDESAWSYGVNKGY